MNRRRPPQPQRPPPRQRLGRARRLPALDRLGIWLYHHRQTLSESLDRLRDAPLASGMTVTVIAISLALPALLYVLSENLRLLVGNWEQTAAISLFLDLKIDDQQAQTLASQLRSWPEIARVEVITREQALAEFRDLGGFEEALDRIKENPLPIVLAVYPQPDQADPAQLEGLQERLLELPEADFARMDTLWLQRLEAIIALMRVIALLIGSLLGIGVLLIVGNTIRLEISNRHTEIEVMELVGATPGFIRRPFLYTGAWYGLLGGALAWVLVGIALLIIQAHVSRLASLYHSAFKLTGLGLGATGILIGASILLGLIGSWLAVSQHLRQTRTF
ncbi:cell division protein FtsX [Caldichromatium japonicum]|uniref:Cell division protein FtsX n=1 Tax=Caldichromatium japonicum TaxID=2699430 RepID=A0A6G7VAT4_9GAMM|nr:permease-like cell division protein FtsX [Caldichromatium japonicum]QIK36897.1 cell division protein FtsX [Caldichromatium japonicum]